MCSNSLPSIHGRKRPGCQAPARQKIPKGCRWLKAREVAGLLGVSLGTVYRLHHRGQLPSFRLPGMGVRVDRKQLDELIAAAKTRA